MSKISRRGALVFITSIGAVVLSGCSKNRTDFTKNPDDLLKKYFYEQMTIDVNAVSEANKRISENIMNDFSFSEDLYESLGNLSDKDLDLIINQFSNVDKSFSFYDVSKISKEDKAYLATVSCVIASELSNELGSEGSLQIDYSKISKKNETAVFPNSGLTASSTSSPDYEMKSWIESLYPEKFYLVKNEEYGWLIDGKTFVNQILEDFKNS